MNLFDRDRTYEGEYVILIGGVLVGVFTSFAANVIVILAQEAELKGKKRAA